MQTINILIKTVYGNQHAYPNCDTSKLFAQLTGKKTFGTTDLSAIKKLGYAIEISNTVNNLEQLLGA